MLLFGLIPTEPWDIFLTPSFWWFVVLVIVLIVVERVISWVARRTVVRLNLPKTAANNLIIGVRLIMVIIAITAALPLFGIFIPSELLVAITASLATAIALFISFSLTNVVAGIYLLVTRPFAVGDYVKIGDVEGIVEELSINYTTIYTISRFFAKLPNQTVLNNPIINYRIRERLYEFEEQEKKRKEIETPEELAVQTKKSSRVKKLVSRKKMEGITEAIIAKKLYGYTFEVGVRHEEFARKKLESRFDRVLEKWEPVFKYRPRYRLFKVDWYIIYRFRITVEEPIQILDNRHAFLEDVLDAIRPEKR